MESQGALLQKVEELSEQLKQERQRAVALEGQVSTTSLSLQSLDKVSRLHLHVEIQAKTQDGHEIMQQFPVSAAGEDIWPGGREGSDKEKLWHSTRKVKVNCLCNPNLNKQLKEDRMKALKMIICLWNPSYY